MMLFYKAWRESQVRFLSGAVALAALCCSVILWPAVTGTLTIRGMRMPYQQYVYLNIFASLGRMLFVLLVIFLGLGGLRRERGHQTAAFTLALPVSRAQLLGTQIAVGLAELAVLAVLPALLVRVLSALVHQSYPMAYGMSSSLLWFICGTVIFAISFFLSVVLRGEYTAAVGCFLALSFDMLISNWRALHPYHTNLMRNMDARWDWYRRGPDLVGPLPWTLLLVTMMIGLVLFVAATLIRERQDL